MEELDNINLMKLISFCKKEDNVFKDCEDINLIEKMIILKLLVICRFRSKICKIVCLV